MYENTQTMESLEANFLQHVGIDRKNLQQLVKLEKPFLVLAEQEYRWNDIFGKKSVIDLDLHMKKSVALMREKFHVIKSDILKKINEYLPSELKKIENEALYFSLIDMTNPLGLVNMTKKEYDEKEKDRYYLLTINQHTYQILKQDMDILSRSQIKNVFSGNEMLFNVLGAVDDFLQQRYEICRCEAMLEIYDDIIKKASTEWKDQMRNE